MADYPVKVVGGEANIHPAPALAHQTRLGSRVGPWSLSQECSFGKGDVTGIAPGKANGVYAGKGRQVSIDAARVRAMKAQGLGEAAIANEFGIDRRAPIGCGKRIQSEGAASTVRHVAAITVAPHIWQ